MAGTLLLASTAAAQDAGREPVAQAGLGEAGFALPLRGSFDALFVGDCSSVDVYADAPAARLSGMEQDIALESGVPLRLDLAPGPYVFTFTPGATSVCGWALFLDPR